MIRLSNAHVTAYVNNVSHTIGEIFVDDATELPAVDGIEGYTLVQGSIAYVVHSGGLYVMDGVGTWHNSEDGTTPTAPGIVTQSETVAESEIQVKENLVDVSNENTEEGDGNDKLA